MAEVSNVIDATALFAQRREAAEAEETRRLGEAVLALMSSEWLGMLGAMVEDAVAERLARPTDRASPRRTW